MNPVFGACDDHYTPDSPMPSVGEVWTPPGTIPGNVLDTATEAVLTLSA